jgi:hypothetical protein
LRLPSRNNTTSTRCSRAFGHHILQSFVTCHIRIIVLRDFFAISINVSVIIRTCDILPLVPSSNVLPSTDRLSIIITSSSPLCIVAVISSNTPVVRICTYSFAIPSLHARSDICPICSSPDTYSTLLCTPAHQSASWSDSVDFHIPGSPESSISDPDTIPPPSTLSSSPDADTIRILLFSDSDSNFCTSRTFHISFLVFHFSVCISSTRVFHSLQCGHFPAHFRVVLWQAVHTSIDI